MSAQENLLVEYKELRSEIQQEISLHNSLITFMITTVVAVLAFALDNNNILLYLLPFGIIIPISMRVVYYRYAMVKLAAYIIVFLESEIEGLNWETRNRLFLEDNKMKFYDKITISHYYEGIILSIISYSLYIWKLIENGNTNKIYFITPILLIVWEALITIRIASFDKDKKKWVCEWEKFKISNG